MTATERCKDKKGQYNPLSHGPKHLSCLFHHAGQLQFPSRVNVSSIIFIVRGRRVKVYRLARREAHVYAREDFSG